jgi:hypothetical protein
VASHRCAQTKLGCKGVEVLCAGLVQSASLQALQLPMCEIGALGAAALGRVFELNSVSVLLRVRVEIMGSQKCGIVGKSQSVPIIMINPIIFTRTRNFQQPPPPPPAPSWWSRQLRFPCLGRLQTYCACSMGRCG